MERTLRIKLQSGRWVDALDYSATPPPPEGYLRCIYCGQIMAKALSVPYREQSRHESCVTGIDDQSFMGRGWAGWAEASDVQTEKKQDECD